VQVIAVALEELVRLDVEYDVEVAGRATETAGFALAGVADAGVLLDAGGDLDQDLVLAGDAGVAAAGGAGCADDRAGAAAHWAGARDGEEALLRTDLAAAAALLAGLGLFAGGGAGATAVGAGLGAADGDLALYAEDGLFKARAHVVLQVAAALLAGGAAVAAAHVEHLAEEIAEDVAEVALLEGTAAAGEARAVAECSVAVAVVGGALVGIGEDAVGLAAGLELLLGLGVVGITVGMVLHGKLAIRGFDLAVGSGAFDAQQFVVVGLHGGWHREVPEFSKSKETANAKAKATASAEVAKDAEEGRSYSLVWAVLLAMRTRAGRRSLSRSL
jgi:hypothetical protein